MKICPSCHQEGPPGFDLCWNCGADLSGAAPAAAEPPAALAPEPGALGRRTLALELVVVLLLTFVPGLVGAIWATLEPLPTSVIGEAWGVCANLGQIALVLYLVWRERGSLGPLGLRRTSWVGEAVRGAGILVVVTLAGIVGAQVAEAIELPSWEADQFEERHDGPLALRLLLPLSFLVAAFSEEVVYRAYLWHRLAQLTGRPGIALVISAALFAVVHARSPDVTFSHFVYGLVLGAFFVAHRSLPRLVLAHWATNLLIVYGFWDWLAGGA